VRDDCVKSLLGFAEVLPVHHTSAGASHATARKPTDGDALRLNYNFEPPRDSTKVAALQLCDDNRRGNNLDPASLE